MRYLVTLFLIAFVGTCPLFCEAAGPGQGTHGCEADAACPHPAEPSSPCTDDGGSCICNGAIQAADVRVPDLDAGFLADLARDGLPPHAPGATLSLHLTPGGVPTGLAGFGDAGDVRSLLQNFRC